jgi:hypothetical protein
MEVSYLTQSDKTSMGHSITLSSLRISLRKPPKSWKEVLRLAISSTRLTTLWKRISTCKTVGQAKIMTWTIRSSSLFCSRILMCQLSPSRPWSLKHPKINRPSQHATLEVSKWNLRWESWSNNSHLSISSRCLLIFWVLAQLEGFREPTLSEMMQPQKWDQIAITLAR